MTPKDQYQYYKDNNLCAYCHKTSPVDGHVICQPCREINWEKNKISRLNTKIKTFEAYGGAFCKCCGESGISFLTIDHIDGKGAEHRRELYGANAKKATGMHMYSWLKKNQYPEGFQVLCFNCNASKHINGVCEHQQKQKALAA